MPDPILQAKNLNFAYSPDKPTLRDISLSLEPGQILAILGPNGSGKSTLIKVLLGHLRASGSIAWQGRALHDWSRKKLARRIAYLPQSPTYDPAHTVRDHLRLGRAPYWQILGLESEHDIDVIQKTAKLLDLTDLLHRPIDHLSGGQRQRVFLARCLIQEPKVLLLDEPNTHLDLHHQVDLLKLLRQFTREQQLAVILASHDINLSAAFADQLILLNNGAIAASGTPYKVLWPETLAPIYKLQVLRLDAPSGPVIFPKLDK
ncbi:MAG TPA: ABC transporter ATP-binding protein [Tepidisphaeraceae bacterium]|nr:ABC transporter ATP-binding protein [Tepidisphaeraceae bacterium]